MRRNIVLRRIIVMAVALAAAGSPAYAEPADGDGNKVVGATSFEYYLECDGVGVSALYEEWGQEISSDDQVLLLVHVTRTYTVEGESLPFLRFVSSFADRAYQDGAGDATSSRAGLDEGFVGHTIVNEATGDVTRNGRETVDPDGQACAALSTSSP